MKVWTWLRQKMCRHLNCAVELDVDGPAPGWSWHCYTCGAGRTLEK